MAARSPQEIRASVENTRQELEYSLNDLQSKVTERRLSATLFTDAG